MSRKLVAALACRNQGTRLYGKPLQNLDIDQGISILEYMIQWLKTFSIVEDTVLGISEGSANAVFIDVARMKKVSHVIGDEEDVLMRLIQCAHKAGASDILRLTTESPFTYFEALEDAWTSHVKEDRDATFLDNLPDGSGFEILSVRALEFSHKHGERRHRSELCTLYMRENKEKFKIGYVDVPGHLRRTDLRLTVDYPEDLILCRAVFKKFKSKAPLIPLKDIIEFLDQNPTIKALSDPFVDEGLKTMYI